MNDDINIASKFNKPLDKSFVNTDQSKVDQSSYFNAAKQQYYERDKSVITDMFQGIVGDKIICQSCNKPKYKYDSEMMISLPLATNAPSTASSF